MIPFFTQMPNSLNEFIGQENQITQIKNFFAHFKKGKALFLYGPSGVGKTSSIYVFAKEQNYELLELNASDTRNAKSIKEFLSKACGQMSLFATKKIILIDEVDGLSGRKDRGAANAIASFIKSSPFPIVITGEHVFDKKFSTLKKLSTLIEFSSLRAQDITKVLKETCKQHSLNCSTNTLQTIARQACGDVRGALNDLFSFVVVKESNASDMSVRKQTKQMGDVLIKVFKSTDPNISFGAYDDVAEDLDKIFLWIDYNIPREYRKSKDLSNAYTVLSKADIFFGRIRRWQYYRFYAYCYLLLSVGIALSKEEKYKSAPNYKQSTRPLSYWKANMTFSKRKSIVEKIARVQKCSTKTALHDSFPLLQPALTNNKALQEELDLTQDEISWIKKQVPTNTHS